jgi:hypothetical protein
MISLDGLALPDALYWSDQWEWTGVAAQSRRTIGGRQVVQSAAVAEESGRPVTLGSEHAWIAHGDLLTLQAWCGDADKRMALTLHDGSVRTVRFRHEDAPVLEATPVKEGLVDPGDEEPYRLRALRLAVVA